MAKMARWTFDVPATPIAGWNAAVDAAAAAVVGDNLTGTAATQIAQAQAQMKALVTTQNVLGAIPNGPIQGHAAGDGSAPFSQLAIQLWVQVEPGQVVPVEPGPPQETGLGD